jgi:hypothetical protein
MTARERRFNLRLLRQEPVQGSIELVFVDCRQSQFCTERTMCSFTAQGAGHCEFGARLEHALRNQRQHPSPLRTGLQELVELQPV